ncbi:peroxisomal N(1)-acetyl-spermine/spermidine oxidase-like [Thrips palmi]|uniref:Peroxisomal N(1)-acetyl-spermine/spermidine oxidase-like n=1 Tax=Thrips palmi TaxID=161013 RepID=A0A6P8YG23_THRPL|nr:peroxisomal N(1)-acetyl-spermine/spermidine oxidase-like [Thrips palmi]
MVGMLARAAASTVVSRCRLLRTCTRRASGGSSMVPAGGGDCCPRQDPDKDMCLLDPCALDPDSPQPRVVVVGAGVAGLSAAQRLAQCGLCNVTVLEATDRPGGRVHSCWLGDSVVELGAQWLYGGCPNNSVYSLAAREGLLTADSHQDQDKPPLFCTSDGRAVEPCLARAAHHTFALIESQARSLFTLKLTKPTGALLTFLHRRMQQEVLRYPEELRYDVSAVMHGLANDLRCRVGADLASVSADHFGSAVKLAGGSARLPMGFVGVLAPLLRDLPEETVHYCKVVEKIQWGSGVGKAGGRARVRTRDGAELEADYVVVTVPLGVLKSTAESLFSPSLPTERLDAIRDLGNGVVNKIFLEYAHPFWLPGRGSGALKLAWTPDELLARASWTTGIAALEEVPGSRAVLCAWVAGDEARCMENESDDAVAEAVTRVLRRFTGDPSLPYPETILRSRWTSDPFFQGSVSYLGLESNVGQQCDLSAPLPSPCAETPEPTLLFAGEATCPGHFATVHGARLSGLREAERILALTRRRHRHQSAG